MWNIYIGVMAMVFNATFNNISVIPAEETEVSRKNHGHAASHWQTLSHIVSDWVIVA
jgi:hypothetical protein